MKVQVPMQVILLLFCVVLSNSQEQIRGTSHTTNVETDCVDVSKWDVVDYNETSVKLCGYYLNRQCVDKEQDMCIKNPSTKCTVQGYVDCIEEEQIEVVSNDITTMQEFTPKDCVDGEKKFLRQTKRRPVCVEMVKQVCESKWCEDEAGNTVWCGDGECEDVVTEDCTLEEYTVDEQIQTYVCKDGDVFEYAEPVFQTTEVNLKQRRCAAKALPQCELLTDEPICVTVTWQDCTEELKPNCFWIQTKIPSQEYLHNLKCLVGQGERVHHVELPQPLPVMMKPQPETDEQVEYEGFKPLSANPDDLKSLNVDPNNS